MYSRKINRKKKRCSSGSGSDSGIGEQYKKKLNYRSGSGSDRWLGQQYQTKLHYKSGSRSDRCFAQQYQNKLHYRSGSRSDRWLGQYQNKFPIISLIQDLHEWTLEGIYKRLRGFLNSHVISCFKICPNSSLKMFWYYCGFFCGL